MVLEKNGYGVKEYIVMWCYRGVTIVLQKCSSDDI
jgi:hypothetical protein